MAARRRQLRLLGNDLAILQKVNRCSVHARHFPRRPCGAPHTATDAGSKTFRLPGRFTLLGHGPRSRPRRAGQRSDLLCISRCRRIVDDHGEIGPTIDGEGRVFEGERAEYRMPYVLDGLAMASNIIVPPECLELRAEPAEFID